MGKRISETWVPMSMISFKASRNGGATKSGSGLRLVAQTSALCCVLVTIAPGQFAPTAPTSLSQYLRSSHPPHIFYIHGIGSMARPITIPGRQGKASAEWWEPANPRRVKNSTRWFWPIESPTNSHDNYAKRKKVAESLLGEETHP